MGEWKKTKLGFFLQFSNGKKSPKRNDLSSISVYGSNGIIGYCNKFNSSEKSIIIGRVGSYCGSVYFSAKKCWITDNAICATTLDDNIPSYFFYLLSHLNLNKWREGSGQPLLNQAILKNIEVKIPPLLEQKAIAHILGSLDDKIELNRKMNETLEQMAQALFKSWFVDFDPVIDNALAAGHEIPEPLQKKAAARLALGNKRQPLPESIRRQFPNRFQFTEQMGWIPEGWELSKLGEYVSVKRGGSPRPIHDYLIEKGLPWVKISDATSCNSRFLSKTKEFIKEEGLKKTVLLKKGELILSNSATPGLPKFLTLDACIHDGWLYFPEKKLFSDLYLYQLFLVIRKELLMQGNGSVFTNLKTDILKNHLLIVPNEKLLFEFDKQIRLIHEKNYSIEQQTYNLTNLRDTLLPKLLSGELRLADAEKIISS